MTEPRAAGWAVPAASGRAAALVALAAGAAAALGQAPFGLWFVVPPALAVVFLLTASALRPKRAFWLGFWSGSGFAAIAMFWIVDPFLVDPLRHGVLAAPALAAMAAGFGVFWGAATGSARWLAGRGGFGTLIAIPATWTLAELARSVLFTGLPWALTSYAWVGTPVYDAAAVVGPHGVTLLTAVFSAALAAIARGRPGAGALALATATLLAAALALFSRLPAPIADGPRPMVRLVQPNADQRQKWDPAMMPVFYERQLALTAEPGEPDLVIWPEVAVPFLLGDDDAPFWEIAATAGSATVILGAQRLDGARAFNSLGVLDPDGDIAQLYDKYHLVPFGEYIPGEWLWSRIGLQALTARYGFGYTAGPGPAVLDLGTAGRVLPLICYESIFPHEIRSVGARPDWMLLITNDAWFGTFSGPFQHLAQARARAVETGMPMVRVANTGVSAVIDPRGRLVAEIPLGTDGRIDARLPAALPVTVYWRLGDIPAFLLTIVIAATALVRRRRLSD